MNNLLDSVRLFREKYDPFFRQPANVGNIESIEHYLLPALKNSSDVLRYLYEYEPRKRRGFLGKLKYFIEKKISNIVKSCLEKSALRQQKFNDVTLQVIEKLLAEIKDNKNRC